MLHENAIVSPESAKLDMLIALAREQLPKRGERVKYFDILDFLSENEPFLLNSEQITFLLTFMSPPLGQNQDNFFTLFRRVSEAAKQTGDLNLVKTAYARGLAFYEKEKNNPKKAALLEEGIAYLLSNHARHSAGELCLKLAMESDDLGKRMDACARAIQYLENAPEQYACALAVQALLNQINNRPGQKLLHYSVYGQRIFMQNRAVWLAPLTTFWWNMPRAADTPDSLCLNPQIIKGFCHHLYNPAYSDKNRMLTNNAGPIFHDEPRGNSIVCYFREKIGLNRVVSSEHEFELCDHRIEGGDGYFPLAVGNKWCYKHVGCSDSADQVITREIVAQNGEDFFLSGLDCIFINR